MNPILKLVFLAHQIVNDPSVSKELRELAAEAIKELEAAKEES